MILTLLGAALTVWIAPAFTRQWDDRQKARELKAGFADEIATAASRSLAAGVDLADTRRLQVRRDSFADTRAAWDMAALRIGMKLRAYFPAQVAMQWGRFADHVHGFLRVCEFARPFDRNETEHSVTYRRNSIEEDLVSILRGRWRRESGALAESLTTYEELSRNAALDIVKGNMLTETEQVTDAVLAAHPGGFSTTRGDLLRDLLP